MPDKKTIKINLKVEIFKGEVIDERRFTMPDFPNAANAQEVI
jgi:hypothetical protein